MAPPVAVTQLPCRLSTNCIGTACDCPMTASTRQITYGMGNYGKDTYGRGNYGMGIRPTGYHDCMANAWQLHRDCTATAQ